MARNPTDSATLRESHELVFERGILAMVQAALADIPTDTQAPNGMSYHCAHEIETSKPPAIVAAVERVAEEVHETGIWEMRCAVEFRFSMRDTGYLDRIYTVTGELLNHSTLETDLTANEKLVVPGGVLFDQEPEREIIQSKFEVRRYAWTMYAGLNDTYLRHETDHRILAEDDEPLRTELAP